MKKLAVLILLGLALRLVLIPSYVHPDLRGFNFAAYLINTQGQLPTFYDYLSRLPPAHQLVRLYHADLFIYPPLAYLAPALFMKLLSPLYPWPVFLQFIYDIGQAAYHPQLHQLVFLLKFPYILVDFLGLFLLLKIVPAGSRLLASLFWLFNPIILYTTYLIGQFDIYIAVFTLLCLYFISRGHRLLAPLSLGIAAAFKPFPLIFLPFLPGSKPRNITLGVVTYLLLILPYVSSPGFRQFALLAPQSQKILGNPIFAVGLVLLFWLNLFYSRKLPLWAWLGTITLLFYSTTHFHPQWLMWSLPFLVISAATVPASRLLVLALVGVYFLFVATFESSLNIDILRLSSPLSLPSYFLPLVKVLFSATSLALVLKWQR